MQSLLGALRARVRSLWSGVRQRDHVEAEMAEEFRLHQELRTADLVRAGLPPDEAARRARLEFGSTERFKEEARRSRGLRRIDQLRVSWLDFRLGFRMLLRYPGLTLVGGLAFAFAIAVGAAGFELITQVAAPSLPLPDGERIVAIRAWDTEANDHERRLGYDFSTWASTLRTVEELGAHRTVGRNLVVPGGDAAPVTVAEISASAFRVASVPPLLGRALLSADERPDAPAVVVIGHDAWQGRFAGDPAVVGRTVTLDGRLHTVVGVMPEGFAFPWAHSWWVPLRLDPAGYAPGEGPALEIFGRLAHGATLAAAQAELSAAGQRVAADFPQTRSRVRPEVLPYGESLFTMRFSLALRAAMHAANLPLLLFLVLVCGNVAMLTFARAATRESELVVRTALGASRGRIVMQLFAEALVLGGMGAMIGLAAAGFLLRLGVASADGPTGSLPFWIRDGLSPATVLYAAALTVLGAAIAGVVPALKVTRGLAGRLRAAGAGGGGRLRFGGIWTAVIVTQVAVTLAFPLLAHAMWRDRTIYRAVETTFPAGEYLMVQVGMEPAGTAAETTGTTSQVRLAEARTQLERQLVAEQGVIAVTRATVLPLMYHPWRRVEIEGAAAPAHDPGSLRVSSASVADDFFTVFDATVIAGRGFSGGDFSTDARAVIVNQSFVNRVLDGRSPLGQRVRYTAFEEAAGRQMAEADPGPWYEIVGVVPDLGMKAAGDPRIPAGVYHPLDPETHAPLLLAARVQGDPASFQPRLRAVAASIDPALRLTVVPMSQIQSGDIQMTGYIFRLFLVVSALALTLSMAGVYSVTSFTVARRTREIGIRVALGADRRRVVAAIIRGPLAQAGLGVLLGCGLLTLAQSASSNGLSLRVGLMFAGYGATLFAICLLACLVPARRALRVEPTEALRAEG